MVYSYIFPKRLFFLILKVPAIQGKAFRERRRRMASKERTEDQAPPEALLHAPQRPTHPALAPHAVHGGSAAGRERHDRARGHHPGAAR